MTLLDLYALTALAVQPFPHPLDRPAATEGDDLDRMHERAGRAKTHADWIMYA
jgi:hypothetical protein